MKRFFTLALAGLAVIALLFASHVLDPVVSVCRYVKIKVKEFTAHVVSVLADPTPSGREPAVLLIQAKAFVSRLAQRKRPEITGAWRMCTST